MRLAEAREEYLDYLVVERGSSPNTVDAYGRDVARYVRFLQDEGITDADDVTRQHVERFVGVLAELDYAASSTERALAAVRGFHGFW